MEYYEKNYERLFNDVANLLEEDGDISKAVALVKGVELSSNKEIGTEDEVDDVFDDIQISFVRIYGKFIDFHETQVSELK